MSTSTAARGPNRLIHALSPYLLQHAYNPVDWWEWGAAALSEAARQDKPIFLSIGYAACHWCHVMERESFENEETAAILNRHFICIKVDREERPDLDDLYMTATQVFTRSGGWPMSVWLTPDLRPFYAGTYFPPEPRYGRPGFRQVLLFLAEVWDRQRDQALRQAEAIMEGVRLMTQVEAGGGGPSPELIPRSAAALAAAFDPVKGGISFGGPNKFPPCMAMDLLLQARDRAGSSTSTGPQERRLLELIELTLNQMANGGIFDHLGGGFARYSTDPDWLVPHFEKMLYDQALLADIYLKAWQVTRRPWYARIAQKTLDYVLADLRDPAGGFYSSRDADSEGVEGKFYVWSKAEVEAALGSDARLFCEHYDVTEDGNWEGHNILHTPRPLEVVARLNGLAVEEAEQRLERARRRLHEVRERRVKPALDEKVLTAWNGLMISSLARGGRILAEPKYVAAATRAADFLGQQMLVDGRLHRVYRGGRVQTPGFLEDYAFFVAGLLDCYETTFEARWLNLAAQLNDAAIRLFHDAQEGGFHTAAADAEGLLMRNKDFRDNAIPSGNSVQIMNLLRLSVMLDRPDLERLADEALALFSGQLEQSPFQGERMLAAVDFRQRGPCEVLLIGRSEDQARMQEMEKLIWNIYIPNLVIERLWADGGGDSGRRHRRFGSAAAELAADGPAVCICRDGTCLPPERDPARIAQLLGG